MQSLSVLLGYRPIRVGWCIRDNNLDDFQVAVRLTHCLWGGCFNPLIPIGNVKRATDLVRRFEVDVLFPAVEDDELDAFAGSFQHLRWPEINRSAILETPQGPKAQLLDFAQCAWRLEDYQRRKLLRPDFAPAFLDWRESDPLANVFLATFGNFPPRALVGVDYPELFKRRLNAETILLSPDDLVAAELLSRATPNFVTEVDLQVDFLRHPFRGSLRGDGIVVGDSANFGHLVDYWNLRAAGLSLYFFDFAYQDRLSPLSLAHLEQVRQAARNEFDLPYLWHFAELDEQQASYFGGRIVRAHIDQELWPQNPVLKTFASSFHETTIAADDSGMPRFTMPLLKKPFSEEPWFHRQKVAISISPIGRSSDDRWTFAPPFLPQLNAYYSRNMVSRAWALRSEPRGIAVIEPVARNSLALRGLEYDSVISEIFSVVGLEAKTSENGLLAKRLIRHLGGLQACRVFKIRGVRELLRRFSPDQTFTHRQALHIIGPGFVSFRDLYIEPRERDELRPQDAFLYLAKRKLLRAGQRLKCPNCDLRDWYPLDRLGSECVCEFCGQSFDPITQLMDLVWQYRRSPLCGRPGQDDAVSISLTLQQLDTVFKENTVAWTPCMRLVGQGIECELDFATISRQRGDRERDALLIGEVKSDKEISEDDVRNLSNVADLVESGLPLDVYVVFAKTGEFAQVEIDRCQEAQRPFSERVILLSGRQLEPYEVYDWTPEVHDQYRHAFSAHVLAQATTQLYFGGRCRFQDGWRIP